MAGRPARNPLARVVDLAFVSSPPGGYQIQNRTSILYLSVRTRNDGDQSVNAPARLDLTPRLEDFPYRLTANVRYADLDPHQHVNNAVYATYFETGRVTLMKDRSYGLTPDGLAWIMVRLDMHFRAELRWPGAIQMGLWRSRVGPTPPTS